MPAALWQAHKHRCIVPINGALPMYRMIQKGGYFDVLQWIEFVR